MEWQLVPVFVINRDNLERGFRRQVEWLRRIGIQQINVVDNGSTYAPLLKYYEDNSWLNVIRKDANLGPWVFWETKMYETVNTPYIVSDADVAPDKNCPDDLIAQLLLLQEKHVDKVLKVGPGLRIDNLPDTYIHKETVIAHETQFSLEAHKYKLDGAPEMFEALIDTTFALYRAGEANYTTDWCKHFRLAAPYVFEHVPWTEDSTIANEEREYYSSHANVGWRHW